MHSNALQKTFKKMQFIFSFGVCCLLLISSTAASAEIIHLKDIARVQGVTTNQLIGYGVVTGLAGTGDSTSVVFTSKTIQNMLQSFGINTALGDIQTRNVAAVTVTAQLSPFAHSGDTVDVTVSSMGDATSLQGGTLVLCELRAADSLVYATAQGAVSIGGFSVGTSGGGGANTVTKNHPAVGRIPQGGLIARTMHTTLQNDPSHLDYALTTSDAITASRVARALNAHFGPGTAHARDYQSIWVNLPSMYVGDPVDFLAEAGDIRLDADQVAKVVLNEKTGTVVMGGDITLAPVAIAHGNLSITVTTTNEVVQPGAVGSFTTAQSATQTNTRIHATEGGKRLILLNAAPTLAQVVRSLNTIGVSPRDLIAIVQALHEAGSLKADVEII